jgi:metal transporter CNNM
MSILLDYLLGADIGTVHSRTELMEMLKLQIKFGAVDEEEGEMAKQVAEGALSFRDKQAQEVMTPLEDAYMLSTETRLGYTKIREIFETGFSRVPVYGKDKHDYSGLLYTKDLMLADPEDEMKLGDFIKIFRRKVECFSGHTKLVDALNAFKKGGTHMGIVQQPDLQIHDESQSFEIVGVLTLEDIVEEIIQEEIVDETDVYVDVDQHIRVRDGREKTILNLGIFNPILDLRREQLGKDETAAVAAHLGCEAFRKDSQLKLSPQALQWLLATSLVQTRKRRSPVGVEEPEEDDLLYVYGNSTETCILVLQGRVCVRVGRDGFRTEVGAFAILARDALQESASYVPDFSAFLSTPEVRYLSITKKQFLKAQALDEDNCAMENAWSSLQAFTAGELSREDAHDFCQQSLCWSLANCDDETEQNDCSISSEENQKGQKESRWSSCCAESSPSPCVLGKKLPGSASHGKFPFNLPTLLQKNSRPSMQKQNWRHFTEQCPL